LMAMFQEATRQDLSNDTRTQNSNFHFRPTLPI
jgi:hypothetical protein